MEYFVSPKIIQFINILLKNHFNFKKRMIMSLIIPLCIFMYINICFLFFDIKEFHILHKTCTMIEIILINDHEKIRIIILFNKSSFIWLQVDLNLYSP